MNTLVLTADQILAIAFILKAKYLDYYYISLANRDENNKLWFSETTKQLVSQGILIEDFSGNTTIDLDVEALVKPMFFGSKESSLDVNIFGNMEENKGYRFHFLDDKITMARTIEGGFEIMSVNYEDIRNVVASFIPAGYSAKSSEAYINLDATKVSRVFVVKSTEVEVKSVIATFVESEGVVYEEDADNTVCSVSGNDFKDKLYKIITEV